MHQRELSDVELLRLGVTTIRIVIASVPFVQLLLVNAWFFSADVVAAVEGVDVVRKEKFNFFEESWTLTFVCLASRHQSRIPSTEKQVLGPGIMAQSTPSVPIPPGICWAFQYNRPFPHSRKQRHQLEARVDKIQ